MLERSFALEIIDNPELPDELMRDVHRDLTRTHRTAALYVSHDLAVVATLATRVAVMYAGRVVEVAPSEELFQAGAHPYTRRR